MELKNIVFNLIQRCSTDLPADIEAGLRSAREAEEEGSTAVSCLDTILLNIRTARENMTPVCQDTGVPLFYAAVPDGYRCAALKDAMKKGIETAAEQNLLRPNCVETVSGNNTGTAAGDDMPFMKFSIHDKPYVKLGLLLKGGGSENVSAQMKLPDSELEAGRDFDGVRKAVLRMVLDAQGKGCAPGIIAVGIGGDREFSFTTAKKQLFRKLDDTNPEPALAELEQILLEEINSLGIGPMGLGGRVTALAVKTGTADRHPACYYVTLSYMCWAARRYEILIKEDGTYEYAD